MYINMANLNMSKRICFLFNVQQKLTSFATFNKPRVANLKVLSHSLSVNDEHFFTVVLLGDYWVNNCTHYCMFSFIVCMLGDGGVEGFTGHSFVLVFSEFVTCTSQ